MKNTFLGYYQPSTEDYESLWKDALIVVDTNVLLSLYRLPTTARDELLGVLELLKERLWVPHQVALEFQRRRLTVITGERKVTEETLTYANDMVVQIKNKVDKLQIEKRGLAIEPQPLLSELDQASEKLINAIKIAHDAQLDISATDIVRQRLDELLENKVGKGPATQDDLNELIKDGENRYNDKIPPGFADIDKDKNPNEASFIFDHIKFPRKFGDLILWKQLILHAKESKIDKILFITEDKKEDWWWREQGKTVGPHPELIREISRDGGVNHFWMYSSGQFVEHANKYYAATVSSDTVDEIKHVAETESAQLLIPEFHLPPIPTLSEASIAGRYGISASEIYGADVAFMNWLKSSGESVYRGFDIFPEYRVDRSYGRHGYDVQVISDHHQISSKKIYNKVIQGYLEMHAGRIEKYTQVICIPQEKADTILLIGLNSTLESIILSLLEKYPISEIIFGIVKDERFTYLKIFNNENPLIK